MVGGTFDPFHDGHRKLLARSFTLAGPTGTVIIGLTSDEFVAKKRHSIRSYEDRKTNLIQFIKDCGFSSTWSIEPLFDKFGSALKVDFDAIVVSEETVPVAIEINRLRKQLGRKVVDIHQIACVLAEDGRWISGTRVYNGEINDKGRLLK